MDRRLRRVSTLSRALVREIRAENVTFMAGSIAYHAFVSLLPLLLLLLTVASFVGNRTVEQSVLEVAKAVLSRGAGNSIVEELRVARQSTGVSVLGFGVLLWGTLRIFRGLDTAFSDIYETEAENTLLDRFTDGLLVMTTFALAIYVGGTVQSSVVTFGVGQLDWLVARVVAIAGLTVAFFPMYYVFPDTDVTVAEVVPGTVFAAAGMAALESLFGFYVEFAAQTGSRNVVAGVIVLLTWLYFGGLVILLGATVNAVLGNRSRDVSVEPVIGGVSTDGSPVDAPREDIAAAVEAAEEVLAARTPVTVAAAGERETHGVGEATVPEGEVTVGAGAERGTRAGAEGPFADGGREVTLPAPTHVVVDADESLLSSAYRPVRLQVQWTPAVGGAADEEESADGG